ncbi:hypothetical protein G6M26_02145 [Agrobacterium tumefaciens]|nr:hypothetical protein [Agrobacterium tumefaciens]NTE17312.1 hypothetical protein [Agrobacterium tumefaciens]
MKNILFLLAVCFCLSSCALFKRDRISEHNAIEITDFNLPIFLYPSKKMPTRKLLIFFSGDGGWMKFEDNLSVKFADSGFQTIGINARSYFWKQKTPEQAKQDVLQLMRKYAFKYHAHQIYLCGYSFGADVVPFIYNLLPYRAKKHVVSLELLSPYTTTDFVVHFSDLTNISSDHYAYKVDQEVQKISIPVYCFYGVEENEKHLKNVTINNFHLDTLEGNHHYADSSYDKIVSILLNQK